MALLETLIDLPQSDRVHDRPVAQPAYPRHRILDIGLCTLESLDGRGGVGIEPVEVAEERTARPSPGPAACGSSCRSSMTS